MVVHDYDFGGTSHDSGKLHECPTRKILGRCPHFDLRQVFVSSTTSCGCYYVWESNLSPSVLKRRCVKSDFSSLQIRHCHCLHAGDGLPIMGVDPRTNIPSSKLTYWCASRCDMEHPPDHVLIAPRAGEDCERHCLPQSRTKAKGRWRWWFHTHQDVFMRISWDLKDVRYFMGYSDMI